MGPGQKAWWICRFGPCFLVLSAYKVASISLIITMLRYNSIWLYGSCVIIWIFLQFLFNERCLPRKYYYLFIGAGLHAVSVAHIPEDIKLIDTNWNCTKNILWATRLTPRQIKSNLMFQNALWFLFNCSVIITLLVVSFAKPDAGIPTFWPFILTQYPFVSHKYCY